MHATVVVMAMDDIIRQQASHFIVCEGVNENALAESKQLAVSDSARSARDNERNTTSHCHVVRLRRSHSNGRRAKNGIN